MPIPGITPLPDAPSRTDTEADFSDDADDFAAALPPLASEMNASIAGINEAAVAIDAGVSEVADNAAATLGFRNDAQAAAVTALNAPGTIATSATTMALSVGAKTCTIQTDKAIAEGAYITAAKLGDGATGMSGRVTLYNPTTGVLNFTAEEVFGVVASYSSWKISLSAPASLPVASLAEYWAGVATGKAITPALESSLKTFRQLTDAATIAWDILTHGFNVYVILGGNRTLALPSGLKEGDIVNLQVIQPASGGPFTLAIPANFDLGTGVTMSFSTVASRRDRLRGQVLRTSPMLIDSTFKKAGA